MLLARLDDRIDAALAQEVEELRSLADGADPDTGQPRADDVRRLFQVFLERNVPEASEAHITFVDGQPYLRSRPVVPYRLDLDPELTGPWGLLTETERDLVDTPGGPVKYVAVPVRVDGETRGVYVGAFFRDLQQGEVDGALRSIAAVGLVTLLVGCVLAAALAERILGPVRHLTPGRRCSSTRLRTSQDPTRSPAPAPARPDPLAPLDPQRPTGR